MPLDGLQYAGVAIGLTGALLVSQRAARWRRRGFLCWVASNCLLIGWALDHGAWGLLTMYAVYCLTSLLGWWNNRPQAPSHG